MPSSPLHPSPLPSLVRQASTTGSTSGSASPSTRYGSFPPSTSLLHHADLEARLRGSLLGNEERRTQSLGKAKGKGKGKGKAKMGSRRMFERSRERVLFPRRSEGHMIGEDVFDSDADLSDEGASARLLGGREEEDAIWTVGDDELDRRRRNKSAQSVVAKEEDKQWGVVKMEMMARTWGRKGLLTIYAGVYLISTLMSLEANTTPTLEPYFLSLLGSHSLLGTVAIVMNIAYAVGKPPMTKILDVFGRAEGIALAAFFYFLGYILTASATNVRLYICARALAALGGQGLQLAQQIIIADTTTLTNRALITSTISLPWLATTWIGPPLGAFFQSHGEKGYRTAYALFGTLLPLVASVLIGTLALEWRGVKRVLAARNRPEIIEARWVDKGVAEVVLERSVGQKVGKVWRDLDVVGLVALTLGCGLVLLPLSLATRRPESWADPEIWALVMGGVASLTFFGYYEFQWSPLPLLPPRLLRNRTILCGSALGFFHFVSQYCYEAFFTSFLQVAREHSVTDASYIAQSYIFSASAAAIVAGIGAKVTQRYRWIGIVGVLVHMAGTWLMMRARNLDSSTFELVLSQVLGGIGGGFTTIAAQIGCQSVVGHQDVGIATAVFLTITQIGGAVGGAIAGSVWSTLLPARLRLHLPAESHHLISEITSSLPFAMSFAPGTAIRLAINQAYVDVQQRLNVLAIFMLFPALLAVCLMKNVHLEKEDQGQGEGVVVLGRASFLVSDDDGNSETSSLLSRPHSPVH